MIHAIYFPNTETLAGADGFYTDDAKAPSLHGMTTKVDEIRRFTKNGEMASIGWFEVVRDGQVIAEIKESACHVFLDRKPYNEEPFK